MINLEKLPNLNYKKIAIICAVTFVFGILFGYVIFPQILKAILKFQVVLKPGGEIREMFENIPFPLIFKIYVFNVLNKDEVHKGAKPKLQEIGPFVFEEWKNKYDIIDDKEEDTMEYTMKNTFLFSPELSNGLTGNEIVTVPHPFIMGMALAVNVDRQPMLPMINTAIHEMFHHPEDAFWTGTVMDLFFNGLPIDCTSSDFNAKAACSVLETGDVKAVQPTGEGMFKFSVLGANNGTAVGRYKVYRGKKNIHDLGRVILFNEEDELDVWDGDECNQIRGTDSTIFPPFMDKEEGLWAFEPSICRSVGATYEGKSKYSGLPTSRYILDLGDVRSDESQMCYCREPPDHCPHAGTIDLFPCVGTPLVASLPHFFLADPALLEKIDSGLNPNKEDHGVYIDFELISGTPLNAAKRLQFSMEVMPIEEIDCMQTLPEMVFPLFWIEEGAALNKTYVNMLKYQLFLALKFQATVKWLCMIGGSLGGIAAAIIHFKKQSSAIDIPQTTNVSSAPQQKNDIESLEGRPPVAQKSNALDPEQNGLYSHENVKKF